MSLWSRGGFGGGGEGGIRSKSAEWNGKGRDWGGDRGVYRGGVGGGGGGRNRGSGGCGGRKFRKGHRRPV